MPKGVHLPIASKICERCGETFSHPASDLDRRYCSMKCKSPWSIRERIEMLSVPVTESGCWLWTGRIDRGGYGAISINRNKYPLRPCFIKARAHRVSYEAFRGEIPSGLTLDHLCRVRCCVNPDHLEPVTLKENMSRRNTHGLSH